MSAGRADAIATYHRAVVTADPQLLAPLFRGAVEAAIAECNSQALHALVYETYRSNELQAIYYARGRTVIPPDQPVTYAMNNLYSWHGYGLAVDVIHRIKQWDAGEEWFQKVAGIFTRHGCRWGGDWLQRDLPHFQWAPCKPSPSPRARELMRTSGVLAVWQAVGAI
jgi:peptidoglycan L-alanyl-D-glutamate endopeptidase CwlK